MLHKPRVVFDTNIFISAILFGGNPRTCLEMARLDEIELYTSKTLFLELAEKLRDKFGYSEPEIVEIIEGLSRFIQIVEPKITVDIIKQDESDNRVLEVAKEVGADFVVSGDKKHILPLRQFGKVHIVSATDFLKVVL